MSTGRNFKKILEKMGGSEKAKPHSTKEGKVASGARRLKRIIEKQKPKAWITKKQRSEPRDEQNIKRAGYRGGGRTNLLEELGRVEAEPSNRNRRAEVSRIHGELNKGYKKGGRSGYGSGGAVLKGKKVGCQIK